MEMLGNLEAQFQFISSDISYTHHVHVCLAFLIISYCCVITYHTFSSLKRHTFVISQFPWDRSPGRFSWIFCLGSHRLLLRRWPGLHSYLDAQPGRTRSLLTWLLAGFRSWRLPQLLATWGVPVWSAAFSHPAKETENPARWALSSFVTWSITYILSPLSYSIG